MAAPPDASRNPLARTTSRWGERVILAMLSACGAISIFTTIAIVAVLANEAIPFFQEIPLSRFFGDADWSPRGSLESEQFQVGIFALIAGTMQVTVIALIVAVPLGLGAATFLSEYAAPRTRDVVKPVLELLAGIPTVVLGFFAVVTVTPFLQAVIGGDRVDFFNSFSGGLVVGIMLIPTIASVSEDAMSAVPDALREAGYGLGASRSTVAMKVVFPAALSGIVAAIILGMSRAVGETMIVTLAVGSNPAINFDIFSQNQTMTGYIAQSVSGEASRGSFQYRSLFAVGSMLFVMTLGLNVLAARVVRRFRQVY